MKISQSYIQFSDRSALLVVTGKQAACIFRAGKGRITKIASIEIPRDVYFDREGFFMHRGNYTKSHPFELLEKITYRL